MPVTKHWTDREWPDGVPAPVRKCDQPTDEERLTGRTKGPAKFHRWPRPVKLGDPCYCRERTADAVLVKVLN